MVVQIKFAMQQQHSQKLRMSVCARLKAWYSVSSKVHRINRAQVVLIIAWEIFRKGQKWRNIEFHLNKYSVECLFVVIHWMRGILLYSAHSVFYELLVFTKCCFEIIVCFFFLLAIKRNTKIKTLILKNTVIERKKDDSERKK